MRTLCYELTSLKHPLMAVAVTELGTHNCLFFVTADMLGPFLLSLILILKKVQAHWRYSASFW